LAERISPREDERAGDMILLIQPPVFEVVEARGTVLVLDGRDFLPRTVISPQVGRQHTPLPFPIEEVKAKERFPLAIRAGP